jgi:flagellar hook-associated protein 3 FlgL
MRISTAYKYDSLQFDIQNAAERLATITQQVATGKRINQPSDDPVGVGQSLNMRSLQAGMTQYQSNLNSAKGTLGYVDNTASDITDLLNQANQLAVSGASSTTDQNGRNAMASQIATLQSRLIDLGNTKGPDGSYLFAGQKTSTKPYTLNGSTLVFNGDTNPIHVETGPGETIQSNASGEPMISTMYNQLETLKNDLSGGQVGAVSGIDLANIQGSLNTVLSLRGDVGARMQTIQDMTSQWQRRSDELTKNISDVEDIDMSEAMVKYQQANQAYTAALTVAGQGLRLSLLDFIN